MKRFLSMLFSATLAAAGVAQTIPLYENFGSVTEAPQIDALAFANYGSFTVGTSLPFDFQSTRFFTNRGTMFGSPGFRFATATSRGVAFTPATSFYNEVGGRVTASDGFGFGQVFVGSIVGPGGFLSQNVNPSYLLVSAENILNRGYLTAGGGGLVQINGRNVDLARSGVGIGSLDLTPTHFVTDSNYFPDPGIYDNHWALDFQFDMAPATVLQLTPAATNAASPIHAVTNSPFFAFPNFVRVAVSITDPLTGMISAVTNSGGADPDTGRITNIVRQAAFVAVSDTNLAFDVKWTPSTISTNLFQSPMVEIRLGDTNVITGELEFSTLYLMDRTASWTNYVVLTNLAEGTMRPATLILTRTPPFAFLDGSPGTATLTPDFFFPQGDTNASAFVTNVYAGYSAEIESIASRPPNVPGLQITDFPGRVEITAENLNMTGTRLRGSALVSVNATNLVGSRGVVVDSENVIYDLGVPNGTLALQGVARDRVVRLNGTLNVWSGVWTNLIGSTATNQVEEPPGSGEFVDVVTNLVTEVGYHMLIVDATSLQATKPVTTHDFVARANEVVLNDPLTVVRRFLIDAESLTLNSRLTLSGASSNWTAANAPRLRSFSNKGTLSVQNVANLGYDMPGGYGGFTNSGFFGAGGILIRTTDFENSGTITSRVDGVTIEAQTAQFLDASTSSARDLRIGAPDIRFVNSTNDSVGALVLNASRSLSDTGEGANNLFRTRNGFHLPVKPTFGDLLGTVMETIAPRFARVEHSWAGEDRGASSAGFENNVAIGHLILGGDRDVLLSFRGATGGNGMYVDMLELAGPVEAAFNDGDLSAALEIDPSLTIYFANSNVPADELEALSDGRLRRVDFVGAAGFVQVPIRSGSGTAQMERWLRDSRTMDSDKDGIPNAYDPFPLDFDAPVRLSGVRANNRTSIALSWDAQPQTTYQVEYTTSLDDVRWQVLSTFSNSADTPQTATIQDQMAGNHTQRYYRVTAVNLR